MSADGFTFWYGRAEPGYFYRYALTVYGRYDLTDESDLDRLAEKAASDYHSNHDGWESSWPITFYIAATKEGPELARFDVEREVEPVFYAHIAAAPQPDAGAGREGGA